MELKHVSVLLEDSIQMLNVKQNGIYVDCTLGGGGHSSLILKKLTTGHLFCFDQDQLAIDIASKKLEQISNNYTIIKGNFTNILEELKKYQVTQVDGIIYDLGVSSFQFDLPERGFSYRNDGPLDMRMNQENQLTAYQVVNFYSKDDLVRIFFQYGEEKFANHIAKKIVQYRQNKTINTTLELVDIIKAALPAAILRKSGHPAKQVFQAIRIEVNQELPILKKAINQGLSLLKIDGNMVVITFHSLEDRIIKQLFREKTTYQLPKDLPYIPDNYKLSYQLINKKVLIPSEEELRKNPRSHSAKLRGITRIY